MAIVKKKKGDHEGSVCEQWLQEKKNASLSDNLQKDIIEIANSSVVTMISHYKTDHSSYSQTLLYFTSTTSQGFI